MADLDERFARPRQALGAAINHAGLTQSDLNRLLVRAEILQAAAHLMEAVEAARVSWEEATAGLNAAMALYQRHRDAQRENIDHV